MRHFVYENTETQPEEQNMQEETEFSETEPFESQSDDGFEEYLNNYMDDDYSPSSYGSEYSREGSTRTMPYAVESSFHDNLNRQIWLTESEQMKKPSAANVEMMMMDFSEGEPNAIIDDLLFAQNVDASEREVLDVRQSFDRRSRCKKSSGVPSDSDQKQN
ncbi:MAG: hypothetical protein U0T81_04765 [Saprospiraceae bacterium]